MSLTLLKKGDEAKKIVTEFLGQSAETLDCIGRVVQMVGDWVPLFGGVISAVGTFVSYLGAIGKEQKERKQAGDKLNEELKLVLTEILQLADMFNRLSQSDLNEKVKKELKASAVYNELHLLLSSIDTWVKTISTGKVLEKKHLENIVDSLKRKHLRFNNLIEKETLINTYKLLGLTTDMLEKADDIHKDLKALKLHIDKQQEAQLAVITDLLKGDGKDDPAKIKDLVKSFEKDSLEDIYNTGSTYYSQKYYRLAEGVYKICLGQMKIRTEEAKSWGKPESRVYEKLSLCFEGWKSTLASSISCPKNPYEVYIKSSTSPTSPPSSPSS